MNCGYNYNNVDKVLWVNLNLGSMAKESEFMGNGNSTIIERA